MSENYNSPELESHAELLQSSFRRLLGRDLVRSSPLSTATAIASSQVAILSHGTESDPQFNYANLAALQLFETTWSDLIGTPSRHSAEPVTEAERDALLKRVTLHGFIDDYQGVRISAKGQRFMLLNAIVWNLFDELGSYHGQAAALYEWRML
ncbi:MEKHLA domain-containing protein [Rubritalea marina]|uniref:MEKHLA domain-containing protein n=1 Tax=Rubritalea marina TaxID=361055 RepID=UPI00036682A5|nr:MEKHLA domain-containing protein [Rubritalea marina]